MQTAKRPNVMLIYTDQQRLDTISYYLKNKAECPIQTPNIDSLAKDGGYFTNYFVNNPVCAPSRMSFLSGQYPSSIGVGDNGYSFPKESMQIGQILKTYGYETVQIGKLHFEPHVKREHENPPNTYGFDRCIISDEPGCYDDAYTKWVEFMSPTQVEKVRTALPPAGFGYDKTNYSTHGRETNEPYLFEGNKDFTHSAFVASETINYLKTRNKQLNFFSIVGFYSPHPPLNPPKDFVAMVNEANITLPKLGENEEVMDILQNMSNKDWIKVRKYYFAMVAEVDYYVGEIIKTLKEEGIYDDTIIVFTSDHGEYLGDHGRVQKGMPGYECITNVPFIIKYDGHIPCGKIYEELAEGVDFLPTILDYCGVQIPKFVDGKSLKPYLEGKEKQHKRLVFCERFGYNSESQYMVRTKNTKYAYLDGVEYLFDLESDPYEQKNIASENNKLLLDMRKELIFKLASIRRVKTQKEAEY